MLSSSQSFTQQKTDIPEHYETVYSVESNLYSQLDEQKNIEHYELSTHNDDGFIVNQLTTFNLSEINPILDVISTYGMSMVKNISRNITLLQSKFLSDWYDLLNANSIDLTHKITIGLNENSQLFSSSEHPEKNKINLILSTAEKELYLFKEIALQASILQTVNSLYSLLLEAKNANRSFLQGKELAYRLCIKGEMSHFFFV